MLTMEEAACIWVRFWYQKYLNTAHLATASVTVASFDLSGGRKTRYTNRKCDWSDDHRCPDDDI